MSSYTSAAINSLLVTESGRIGEKIYRKKLNSSPWSKLVSQEQWPDEFGTAVSVMTLERSLPANALTWATMGYNPAGDATSPQTGGTDEGNCLPPNQTITFAQTQRSFNLKQTSLNSATNLRQRPALPVPAQAAARRDVRSAVLRTPSQVVAESLPR
jgi:hypothetical protein